MENMDDLVFEFTEPERILIELKTGMLFEITFNSYFGARTEWYVLIEDRFLSLSDMLFISTHELKTNDHYTIMKVATVSYIGDIFAQYKSGESVELIEGYTELYSRVSEPPPLIMTQRELVDALEDLTGRKIQIIQEVQL